MTASPEETARRERAAGAAPAQAGGGGDGGGPLPPLPERRAGSGGGGPRPGHRDRRGVPGGALPRLRLHLHQPPPHAGFHRSLLPLGLRSLPRGRTAPQEAVAGGGGAARALRLPGAAQPLPGRAWRRAPAGTEKAPHLGALRGPGTAPRLRLRREGLPPPHARVRLPGGGDGMSRRRWRSASPGRPESASTSARSPSRTSLRGASTSSPCGTPSSTSTTPGRWRRPCARPWRRAAS